MGFVKHGHKSNGEVAYAYKLGRVKVYETPRTLMEYGVKAVPQSFVYTQA